jgi:hypothetical protein
MLTFELCGVSSKMIRKSFSKFPRQKIKIFHAPLFVTFLGEFTDIVGDSS